MKKFTAILLVLCMVLALVGCTAGGKNDKPDPAPSESSEPSATPKPENSEKPDANPSEQPQDSENPEDSDKSQAVSMSMSEILTNSLAGIENLPMLMETVVTEELYQNFLGIDYITGSSALASDAAIGSIAHSVVLLKLPDDADLDEMVDLVYSSANPRKWICVEAEKVRVMKGDTASGKYILLVMSTEDIAEAVVNNFAYVMSTLG